MKEKIRAIIDYYFIGTDSDFENCENELFELFVKSNPNADWEETLKAENDNDTN